MLEPVVLTINRDEERALKFAQEIRDRNIGVRVSKVRSFGPPELCYARGCYISPESEIRKFLNKRYNLKPPL
jgi:hypothetical protein